MNTRALLCVILSCLFAFSGLVPDPAVAQGQSVPDKWAVIIGISKFNDSSFNLKYAANDAKDFYNYLVTDGHFAPDHVTLLLDDQATRQNVLAAVGDKWLPQLAKPQDLVVIYCSSHGSPAESAIGGVNYLLTADTNKDNIYGTAIAMQDFSKLIKDRVPTDKVLLVLDACHSGNVSGATKGLSRESNVSANQIAQESGRLVIASSEPNQISWESQDHPNGVFTYYLINGLKSKGEQTDLSDAFNFMKDKVQEEVLSVRGSMQTPVMTGQTDPHTLALAIKPSAPRPVPSDMVPSKPAGVAGAPVETPVAVAAAVPGLSSRLWETHLENGQRAIKSGKYPEADKLLTEAQKEAEAFGKTDARLATTLNTLGLLKTAQGKYIDAEPLFRSALTIREKAKGANSADLAESLTDLGDLLLEKGRYTESEALLKRALAIREKSPGDNSIKVAQTLNVLSRVQFEQGKYSQAEQTNSSATETLAKSSAKSADSLELAKTLLMSGKLAMVNGRTTDAKKLLQRALDMQEKIEGADHPDQIAAINALAELNIFQQKSSEAEPLLYKALAIGEQSLGSDHPLVADCMDDLGLISELKMKYPQAEESYKKAMEIREKDMGSAHPAVGESLTNLGWLKYAQEEYPQADSLFRKAQSVKEKALDPDNPRLIIALEYYSYLLGSTSRKKQATELANKVKILKQKNKAENPKAKGNVDERILTMRVSALRSFQSNSKKK